MERRAASAFVAQKAGQRYDFGRVGNLDALGDVRNILAAVKPDMLACINKGFEAKLLQIAERSADPKCRHLIVLLHRPPSLPVFACVRGLLGVNMPPAPKRGKQNVAQTRGIA
jgi:hypothetical protein